MIRLKAEWPIHSLWFDGTKTYSFESTTWWKNFCTYVGSQEDEITVNNFIELQNKYLAEWCAEVVEDKTNKIVYLEFKDEHKLTEFLLRWS